MDDCPLRIICHCLLRVQGCFSMLFRHERIMKSRLKRKKYMLFGSFFYIEIKLWLWLLLNTFSILLQALAPIILILENHHCTTRDFVNISNLLQSGNCTVYSFLPCTTLFWEKKNPYGRKQLTMSAWVQKARPCARTGYHCLICSAYLWPSLLQALRQGQTSH